MNPRNSIEEIQRKTLPPWQIHEKVSKQEQQDLYLHVFSEDVEHQIMPYDTRDNHVQISLENDALHDDLEILLSVAVGEEHYSSERAIVELIRRIGAYLALDGKLYYEVAAITKKPGLGSTSIFAPLLIRGKLIRIGNLYAQIAVNQQQERKVVFLKPDEVWQISLPRELGSLNRQRWMRKHLLSASKIVPDYLSNMQTNWLEDKNYSALEFHNIQSYLAASATQGWGWPARGRWNENALDYFSVYRRLRFACSLAILRNHIVDSLQEFLRRVHIPCKINLIGMKDPRDFTRLSDELHKGKISFEQALAMTW